MSASWIQKLSESDSRLHKEDVILQALTAAKLGNDISSRFLRGLKVCYDPFVTFGVKQIAERVFFDDTEVDHENPWEDYFNLLDRLAKRELTGNAARDAIEDMSMRFDNVEWNSFCAPILRRDMRVGVSEKTINKICKKTEYEIPVFGCQLATNSEGRPEMRGTKRLEPKLDGVRVIMIVRPMIVPNAGNYSSVVCFSRNGKVFDNFSHIEDQIRDNVQELIAAADKVDDIQSGILKQGFVLDGEVVGNTFQELMRQARRKENVNATDSVFHVFDVLPLADFQRGHWNAQLSKRIALLEAMQAAFDKMPNAELLPHLQVDLDTSEGKNQLERYAKDMVNAGFEGIMIKNLDAPYLCKRSTDWMKWKPTITVDLQVIGLEEGTGRNKGRLGALVCNGVDDGKEITVNAGSGFSDTERDSLWEDRNLIVGRTVEILADAVTQNQDGTYSLRFPRFVRFRDDKA
jgi:DNA ligase 1